MEKLFDSELKVMEPLWDDGPQTAGALARRLAERCGWNRNTTYTVIKKLIDKGAVSRTDPGFLCTPLISREQVQRQETEHLLSEQDLTPAEAQQLRELIDRMEKR